jgi:hypothetical protein
VRHDDLVGLVGLVVLDVLDHRVLDAQKGTP